MAAKRKLSPSCACLRAALASDRTPPQLKPALAKRIEKLERQASKAPPSAPAKGHYIIVEPTEAARRSPKMKIKRWSDTDRRYV